MTLFPFFIIFSYLSFYFYFYVLFYLFIILILYLTNKTIFMLYYFLYLALFSQGGGSLCALRPRTAPLRSSEMEAKGFLDPFEGNSYAARRENLE